MIDDCKKLEKEDVQLLIQLVRLYENVFELKNFLLPASSHFDKLLNDEKIIFIVAQKDDKVIGGLTAFILPSVYYEGGEVYIYDLAVKSEYQRKGTGTRLIDFLKNYCKTLAISEIFVQADLPDKYALEFYQATGGIAEEVIHFTYAINKISNGKVYT